ETEVVAVPVIMQGIEAVLQSTHQVETAVPTLTAERGLVLHIDGEQDFPGSGETRVPSNIRQRLEISVTAKQVSLRFIGVAESAVQCGNVVRRNIEVLLAPR